MRWTINAAIIIRASVALTQNYDFKQSVIEKRYRASLCYRCPAYFRGNCETLSGLGLPAWFESLACKLLNRIERPRWKFSGHRDGCKRSTGKARNVAITDMGAWNSH